jgi:hypothetical protein
MRGKTQIEQNQDIIRRYRAAGQKWPATTAEMAVWAIQVQAWAPSRESLITQCAGQFADALREEYYVDPQGRRVRTKQTARVLLHGEQMHL